MCRFTAQMLSGAVNPKRFTRPPHAGCSSPSTSLRNVDLPAPLGPSRAQCSPDRISQFTFRSTHREPTNTSASRMRMRSRGDGAWVRGSLFLFLFLFLLLVILILLSELLENLGLR